MKIGGDRTGGHRNDRSSTKKNGARYRAPFLFRHSCKEF
jgi:hypothetical protein